jgi:hypothetical protein
MRSSPLLLIGLGLLAVSLLFTLLLTEWTTGAPNGAMQRYVVTSWFTQATLYVGAGLTVAGAVLRVLRPPVVEEPEEIDHWG